MVSSTLVVFLRLHSPIHLLHSTQALLPAAFRGCRDCGRRAPRHANSLDVAALGLWVPGGLQPLGARGRWRASSCFVVAGCFLVRLTRRFPGPFVGSRLCIRAYTEVEALDSARGWLLASMGLVRRLRSPLGLLAAGSHLLVAGHPPDSLQSCHAFELFLLAFASMAKFHALTTRSSVHRPPTASAGRASCAVACFCKVTQRRPFTPTEAVAAFYCT